MQTHNKNTQSLSVLGKYTTVFAYLVLFILFSIFAPGFFSPYNVINLLRQISMLAMVTCGLTICIVAGDW